jgi:hypothetical protein
MYGYRYLQKVMNKKLDFVGIFKPLTKRAGFIIQCTNAKDPDPSQNATEPEH